MILGGIDASFDPADVLERNQLDAVICYSRGMRWHLKTGHLMTNDIACLVRASDSGAARQHDCGFVRQLGSRDTKP